MTPRKCQIHAFWADRATTRKSKGHSLFYMAYSIEPVLPLRHNPFHVPHSSSQTSLTNSPQLTSSRFATCARQLRRRKDDIATIHSDIVIQRLSWQAWQQASWGQPEHGRITLWLCSRASRLCHLLAVLLAQTPCGIRCSILLIVLASSNTARGSRHAV